MAHHSSHPALPALAFSLQWRGRRRIFAPKSWVSIALLVGLPLLAAWYLCASLYLVFHDQLLASLISRQTDMQYAYEDRISALRTELDRASSRGMIDRNTLETTIRDLVARGAKLEARAAAIDALVSGSEIGTHGNPLLTPTSPALPADASAYAPSSLEPAASSFRSLGSSALENGDGGLPVTAAPEHRLAALSAGLTRIETRQAATIERLREPLSRSVERMQAALAEVDIPAERWQATPRGDVGGPFVPLPADAAALDAAGFEATLAILRETAAQKARLERIVDRVPLRKPLEGPLEVTSTFGARVDPFYGRPAMHTGIDLHENYGDQVEATAAGVVTVAGAEGGYGNMVEIDHGNGLTTRYAHLSAIEVSVHQRVGVGALVGRVGATGRATGPHLHYETRINGEPVNPARFLKAGSALFPG